MGLFSYLSNILNRRSVFLFFSVCTASACAAALAIGRGCHVLVHFVGLRIHALHVFHVMSLPVFHHRARMFAVRADLVTGFDAFHLAVHFVFGTGFHHRAGMVSIGSHFAVLHHRARITAAAAILMLVGSGSSGGDGIFALHRTRIAAAAAARNGLPASMPWSAPDPQSCARCRRCRC